MQYTPLSTRPYSGTNQPATNGRRWIIFLIKCLISASLIYLVLRDTNLGEIFGTARSAGVLLLVFILCLQVTNSLISTYRWRMLLQSRGTDASMWFLFKSYLVGIFFNQFLPTTIGGDTVRVYDSWRLGQSKSGAVAVVFMDRFLRLFVLLLFAIAALFIPTRLIASLPLLKLGLLASALALLLAAWLMFMPAKGASALAAKVRSLRIKKLRNMLDAFMAFQQRRDVLAKALGLSFIQQANVVFFYYLLAWGLGLPVPLLSFCLIAPLAILLMLLPISINAIGLRENIFVVFFAMYGVSKPGAVAFAWLLYGLAILQGLLGGIIYALGNAQTTPPIATTELSLNTAPSAENQLREIG